MIHELVHQWWGLGNMFDTADPNSPWSAEGLTCYTTYRIAKQLYGEDYARTHYVEPWQQAVDDYYLNFYVRHPEYLERLARGAAPADLQQPFPDASVLRNAPENTESGKTGGAARRPWIGYCMRCSTGSWTPCTPT